MDGRLCAVYRYGRLSGKIYESGGPGEYHPVAGKKQQGKLSGPGGKKPVPGAAPAGKKGRDALSLCGSKSGREIDKAEETGLIPVFDQAAPYFEQASLVLVCKKLYAQPMDPAGFVDKALDSRWYPDKDYHKMFVGEVIKVLVKE